MTFSVSHIIVEEFWSPVNSLLCGNMQNLSTERGRTSVLSFSYECIREKTHSRSSLVLNHEDHDVLKQQNQQKKKIEAGTDVKSPLLRKQIHIFLTIVNYFF